MQVIAGKLNFAFSNYVFEPYHVKIDLFMANTRLYFVDDGKFLGWKDHALDGIIVHKIPGDHEKIFQSPNDAILAKILQDRLDQINDK